MSDKRSKVSVLAMFEIKENRQGADRYSIVDPKHGRVFIHNLDGEVFPEGTKVIAEVDEKGHGIYVRETVAPPIATVSEIWELADLIGCEPYVPEIVYKLEFEIGEELTTNVDVKGEGRFFLNNKTGGAHPKGKLFEAKPAGPHGLDLSETTIECGKVVKVKNPIDLFKHEGIKPYMPPAPPEVVVILDPPRRQRSDGLDIDYKSPSTGSMMATATIDYAGEEGKIADVYIISEEKKADGSWAPIFADPKQPVKMVYRGNDKIFASYTDDEPELLIETWGELMDHFREKGSKFTGLNPRLPFERSSKAKGDIIVTRGGKKREAVSA